MQKDSFLDRKDRLKGEGKVELPLNVDTKKYLIGNIAFIDVFIASPFILLSVALMLVVHSYGHLNTQTIILCTAPTLLIMAFQLIKHPIRRKNLSFLQYGILWKIKYKKRNKEFFYKKGEIDMSQSDQDTRKELGIKNIYSGCLETEDNRFVKVLEVSSINLSLMNYAERNRIFESFRTFLSEMQFLKKIQISQISQPVNLSRYLLYIDRKTEGEKDLAKRMITSSYKKHVEKIQKSKNMVARKRYVIIDQPISSDREKSLQEIERKAALVETNINNMLRGYSKLNVKILQNDELLKLMYTCIDYDNAQALGEFIVSRANNKVSISLGEKTAKEIIATFEKQINENIN
ncbi:hypothetical protein MXL46_14015 [Heyndrickxia sporothermodurans]|uniref:hypothetical protein n=1 Tax=Heyndrickxia sporothermodurans TaxID=46224 RepID=UPI002DBFC3BB|nr:hypothetical protein [Heyndrickxia sporothermodurans]MEB6550207.1 hypothetical protein [Heyndrickxia sporothermodurans]